MSQTSHDVKIARLQVCSFCRHHRNCAQWPWPECHRRVESGQTIDLAEANRLVLDDAFFDGAASNCPADKFIGLAPLDYEAEQRKMFLEMGERFTLLFDPFRQLVGDTEFASMIEGVVAAGGLSAHQAEAMFTVMGIPLDA